MSKISPDTLRFLRQATKRLNANALINRGHGPNHSSISKSRSIFAHQSRLASSSSQTTKAPLPTFPNSPISHYDLFPNTIPKGPPPTGPFNIDLRALRREFIQLQAQAHPDRHPPSRRTAAASLSARINDAYRTLSDPLRRAQYLLSTRGVRGGEDDEGTVGDGQGDPELLMEVMEAREAAEEASEDEEVQGLRRENAKKIEEVVKRLGEAFERDDLESARKDCVRLRYWVGVEDRLREGTNMH
jgi:molecular chaperone HscB